jgi:hypothetical protein
LERINGRPVVLQTKTFFPNDGPTYSIVAAVKWNCEPADLDKAVAVLEGGFRSAPENSIASALYKLRMLTRGREHRSSADQEAEAVIWIENLRCWPGDVVLDVLRTWPSRKGGEWWPTWHDVEEVLKARTDRRQALLNHVRKLAIPTPVPAQLTEQPPSQERRDAAVAHWETVRATLAKGKPSKDPQTAEMIERAANEQLDAWIERPIGQVAVSEGLAAKLQQLKQETGP